MWILYGIFILRAISPLLQDKKHYLIYLTAQVQLTLCGNWGAKVVQWQHTHFPSLRLAEIFAPYVGKLVVAYRWSAVYITEP